jgi:hypothetical protein
MPIACSLPASYVPHRLDTTMILFSPIATTMTPTMS